MWYKNDQMLPVLTKDCRRKSEGWGFQLTCQQFLALNLKQKESTKCTVRINDMLLLSEMTPNPSE